MTLKVRLNPGVDIAFKKIFGVDENKDLLISLINSIVSEQDRVIDIELLNPYNAQNFHGDKLSILDIKAKNQDGKLFNIEMQISDAGDYTERALYYWARVYTNQLNAGLPYETLRKVIGIHILNFSSIQDRDYHHTFCINDKQTNIRHFDHFEIHTLELDKFTSQNEDLTDLVARIQTALDGWMMFLTRHELMDLDILPAPLNDVPVKKAIHVLDVMNFTDAERMVYDDHQLFLRNEHSTLLHREEVGFKRGREEGLVEGKLKAKQDMARNLLRVNIPDDVIMSVSGLTLDELSILKQS